MANYPTSLDSFTNPTGVDSLSAPSHSLQHADANDAIEALEAKLGIGNSPAGSATAGRVLVAGTGGTTTWTTVGASAINTTGGTAGQYLSAGTAGVAQWASVPDAGLTFIAAGTASTQLNLDFTGCFSSTYINYKLFLHVTASSGEDTLYIRFLSGTTPVTTGYKFGWLGSTTGGTNNGFASTTAAGGWILDVSNTESDISAGEYSIMKPFLTQRTTYIGGTMSKFSTNYYSRHGAGYLDNANSYDGLRIFTTGTSFSGIARLYGVKN